MDNPEIKALLKSAKEAIKNKDAKEALKLCKSVIDKDKENYLGWVMTGAAANELNNKDQALAAYQRAIQISGNQAPAWQGLAQLYEKSNSQSELISVYNELRKFFSNDAVKYFDISNKYANCLLSQSKTKEAISVLYELVKNQNTDKNYAPVIENLARLLALSDEQTSSVYFDVIHVIDQNSQIKIENELLEKINENALKSMIKAHESWKKILDHLFDLLENHSPQNQFALITLFEIYSEALISSTQIEQKYLTKIEQLLQEETNKSDCIEQYRILINAVNMLPNLDHNNITEFKKNLDHVQGQMLNTNKLLFLFLENNYYFFVCDHNQTVKTAREALVLLNQLKIKDIQDFFLIKLNYNIGLINYQYHEFDLAIERFKMLKTHNLNAGLLNDVNRFMLESYVRTYKKELGMEILRNEIDKSSFTYELCELIIKYENQEYMSALEIAKNLCNSNPENHDSQILLAKTCYNLLLNRNEKLEYEEIKTLCFQSNIKAIKLSPYKWESIYQLGIYYKYLVKDYKKALKCFQKTYELCLNLSLCGLELVDTLLYEKNDEIAFNFLKKALEEIDNCKWASLRLGVIYLKKGESNEAIRLFYNVIRNNPDDYNMWECLADAYLNRGSLTAALKSFNKVIELNPDSSYAYYQIARIKQTLNLYEQARIDYFAVLNKIPNDVPTFKGLGETYFLMAKENVKNSTDNRYLEYIEMSIKYLTKAICVRKDLCCVWKILGDCCNMIRFYPQNDSIISIPTCILKKKFNIPDTETTLVSNQELFKLAEESYMICCKLRPDCGSYFYDLSLSYLFQYKSLSLTIQSMSDKASLTLLINKSKECLITAVNLDPTDHLFWNNLGILYAFTEINKPHLAQHCFLKSLKIDESDAVTWTNLGVFYLINEENKKAHECFKKSQALDPEYGVAWIGQAFIAETVNIEDCIDLYRHAVELGLHTEAYYGYARIVCRISNDPELRNDSIFKDYIQFLNAIPLSSDCLIKYCDRIINNADAFFLSGVLLEKLNLPLTAIKYYERVFELIDDDENETCMQSRRGYARLLCSQKQYEAAFNQYKRIDVKNSVEDIFSLAKFFYNLGKYQKCAQIFESALNVCTENEKSIVYTAMGMAMSKYNIQEAISCFFKSFQCKVKCIQSLFALCSIGLLKSDKALIGAVFKELDTISDLKYRFDILKLKSVYYCLEKDFDKAIRWVSKYVHEYPAETRGWIELCLCLKRGKNYDLALLIGKIIFATSSQANLIFYECVQFLLLQKLIQNKYKDPSGYLLKMFQTTLHMFPDNIASWSSFSKFLKNYDEKDGEFELVSTQLEKIIT